jgi:hypothetical protein
MGWVVNTIPQPLYPRQTAGTDSIVGWVGTAASLDEYGKSHPPLRFDPRTVQPVAQLSRPT